IGVAKAANRFHETAERSRGNASDEYAAEATPGIRGAVPERRARRVSRERRGRNRNYRELPAFRSQRRRNGAGCSRSHLGNRRQLAEANGRGDEGGADEAGRQARGWEGDQRAGEAEIGLSSSR